MSVRRATLADIPEIATIERQCFPDDAWDASSLAAELSRPGAVLLVAIDTIPVGYAVGWSILGELEVLRVAVLPTARRGGHGRALMVALHEEARADVAFLEVRADNVAAQQLYVQLGYQPVRVRPRYYHDGVDAVMMRSALRSSGPG